MKNLTGKITAVIVAGGLMLGTFASSAFASTNIVISGNGAFSDNHISIRQSNRLYVNQSNWADISNVVRLRANTGFNSANFNTGGDVYIRTGDVNSTVRIFNAANLNRFDNHFFFRGW